MKILRRLLSICAALGIVMSMSGAGYTLASASEILGTEILVNGGFEETAVGTEIPLKQVAAGIFTYNASGAVVSDALAHEGKHSLKITRDSSLEANKEMSLNYSLPLTQGKMYKFSAWVRYAPEFGGTGAFYIRMTDVGDDFVFANAVYSPTLSGSDDFVKIEAVCTPSKDYTRARLNIGVTAKTQNVVAYVDDFSCAEVIDSGEEPGEIVEPITGNLIENSSFELTQLPTNLSVTNVNATRTTEEAHNGKYSYKMEQTKNYGAANYGKLPLEAGKTYYFAAWLRFGHADTVSATFYIRLFWNAADNTGQIMSPKITGEDGWTLMESVVTIPPDAKVDKDTRFNISANPYQSGPVTFYIDDVVLKEVGNIGVEEITWNNIGDFDGIPVCPIDAEVNLTFSGALRAGSLAADAVLLNGAPAELSKITVTADNSDLKKVTIRFSGLDFSKRYMVSLTDNVWRDEYGCAVTIEPLTFKTSGRVAVGIKKLYLNNAEVTDGKLKNGTVRAEVGGLKNMSGTAENVSAILALFRDGEIVEIRSNTLSVPVDVTTGTKVETELNVNMDDSGTYMLKLFVWDDLKSGLSLSAETVLQ